MLSTRERLETAKAIVDRLDDRRREKGDSLLGIAIDRRLIDRELRDLAEEWILNPPTDSPASPLPEMVEPRKPGFFSRIFRSS
ncbi:MAG: hypothetical protein ACKV22_06425 [Bryobacteraceae bacterium]